MCIRDRAAPLAPLMRLSLHTHKNSTPAVGVCTIFAGFIIPVSYTHLLFIGGKNRNQIAVHLKNEQIPTPTFYMKDRGRGTCKNKTLNEDSHCKWNKATLTNILTRQEYCGDVAVSYTHLDKLPFTLSDAMGKILMDQPIRPGEGILHHAEGVDLMPADIQLSGMEVSLVNAMSRETVLRQYLDTLKGQYSHILIDCQPSLGMLTVNALAAANRIIIPVQAEYLPAKGLEQLLSTVNKVKRQINPKLQIDGILLTMVDSRTNFAKEISALLRETYGSKIKVFGTEIPHSVRAKEISAEGKSIFAHDPSGKVAEGYKNLTKEVLKLEKQREKNRAGLGR